MAWPSTYWTATTSASMAPARPMDSQGTDGLSATSRVALGLTQASARLRFTGTCCSLSVRRDTSLTAHASLVHIRRAIMDFLSQRRSLCILAVDIVEVDCLILLNRLQQS